MPAHPVNSKKDIKAVNRVSIGNPKFIVSLYAIKQRMFIYPASFLTNITSYVRSTAAW